MRRLLALVATVVLVDTTFYAAITPLLPELTRDFGLTKAGAGLLAAAYPVGTFAGSLPGGWLAVRTGARRTTLLGLGLMSVASLGFAFGGSALALDVSRFVQGIGGAFSWSGALGWLLAAAPPERRGALIGSAMGAAIAGALLGPVLGAAAGELGHAPVFCAVAVIGAGLMAWAAATPAPPVRGRMALGTLAGALREGQVRTALWLVTIPGLLFGTLAVLAPLRLDALGAGAAPIGAAFLVGAALEALVSAGTGRLSDRRGRLVPALAGLGGGAVVLALLPWPGSAWLLGALVVLACPTFGILWAPSMAMLSDGAEAAGIEQGLAFALMNLVWAVGQAAGNAGASALAQATADEVPYLLLAGVCAVSLAVLAPRARRTVAA